MAPAPDWRSPSAYAYLDQLDPSGLAWEFLRRNPDYQREYRTVTRNPARTELSETIQRRWGLRFPCRSRVASRPRPGRLATRDRSLDRIACAGTRITS